MTSERIHTPDDHLHSEHQFLMRCLGKAEAHLTHWRERLALSEQNVKDAEFEVDEIRIRLARLEAEHPELKHR